MHFTCCIIFTFFFFRPKNQLVSIHYLFSPAWWAYQQIPISIGYSERAMRQVGKKSPKRKNDINICTIYMMYYNAYILNIIHYECVSSASAPKTTERAHRNNKANEKAEKYTINVIVPKIDDKSKGNGGSKEMLGNTNECENMPRMEESLWLLPLRNYINF